VRTSQSGRLHPWEPDDWHVQAPGDHARDVPERHALKPVGTVLSQAKRPVRINLLGAGQQKDA